MRRAQQHVATAAPTQPAATTPAMMSTVDMDGGLPRSEDSDGFSDPGPEELPWPRPASPSPGPSGVVPLPGVEPLPGAAPAVAVGNGAEVEELGAGAAVGSAAVDITEVGGAAGSAAVVIVDVGGDVGRAAVITVEVGGAVGAVAGGGVGRAAAGSATAITTATASSAHCGKVPVDGIASRVSVGGD